MGKEGSVGVAVDVTGVESLQLQAERTKAAAAENTTKAYLAIAVRYSPILPRRISIEKRTSLADDFTMICSYWAIRRYHAMRSRYLGQGLSLYETMRLWQALFE